MTTRNDILGLLQRESLTVLQLCERLGVTRNAINVQLKVLEAEGTVRRAKSVQSGGPGKPAIVYEAAPGTEDLGSSAYPAFLAGLLSVLDANLDPETLNRILETTGRRLAQEAGLTKPVVSTNGETAFERRLAAAMAAADALGASTQAVPVDGGIMVRNYSCPLGGVTRDKPCVCRALAAFFSEATGRPASEHCIREERLICQYLIESETASEGS
ncbi:metalloregulator ArsR/SmtB family transcription factor [Pandoraea sp. ISTKB]|uniref:helix-turn-helix transcriptional regulator n=1 Tax=Pandoraea sp. ISTKB TaxID=1586708 RepID=UPI00084633D4|nr:ArsR family transcriptional regulator [Pandoraea sp. ISTKB]ODP35637.1 transcriptional regulator [Pandoraea sp. ISTKB]